MKQITNKTILKQGDKTYQPVEVEGVVYWVDNKPSKKGQKCYDKSDNTIFEKEYDSLPHPLTNDNPVNENDYLPIVSQSQLKLVGIPFISLDLYIENLADNCVKNHSSNRTLNEDGWMSTGFVYGYNSNPNHYTQKDVEKAIELAREYTLGERYGGTTVDFDYYECEIIEKIISISIIEVDQQFDIISYE
jgi:hypothetical protein